MTPKTRKAQSDRRLTPRQMQILTYIRDFQKQNGYSPTMQELADHLGVSKVTVFEHVETLLAKNLLRRAPYKARSLELTGRVKFPDESSLDIPIAGRIAAGAPIEAIETNDRLNLESMFATRHGTFVLKVRGDSMIDEQIRDGDYVIVEKRTRVRNGETVVALLDDGEATLKKYYKEKNRIRLQPANPDFAPIYVNNVQIQGIVIGILRKYKD